MRCAIEATAGALRILLLGVLCAVTLPGSAGTLEGEALVEALRAGGYNLYFRHAATEWSQDDQVRDRDDLPSCDPSRMRQLSAEGREAARRVGEAMRRLAVPVGEVWASPYCRTVETAEAMAVGDVRTTDDVLNLRAAEYGGGREAIVLRARRRLSVAPAAGTNTVFVAHGNVGVAATTVYPGEGEGLVFRPLGDGGFEYVGRLEPAAWAALAERMAVP